MPDEPNKNPEVGVTVFRMPDGQLILQPVRPEDGTARLPTQSEMSGLLAAAQNHLHALEVAGLLQHLARQSKMGLTSPDGRPLH